MCIFIRRQKCCTTAFNFSTSQNELTRLLWETLAQRSLHFYKDNTLSKPVDEFIWNFLVVRDEFEAIFCLIVGLLALWEYESLHLARPSCNGLKINSFLYIVDFVGDLFVLRVVDYLLSVVSLRLHLPRLHHHSFPSSNFTWPDKGPAEVSLSTDTMYLFTRSLSLPAPYLVNFHGPLLSRSWESIRSWCTNPLSLSLSLSISSRWRTA